MTVGWPVELREEGCSGGSKTSLTLHRPWTVLPHVTCQSNQGHTPTNGSVSSSLMNSAHISNIQGLKTWLGNTTGKQLLGLLYFTDLCDDLVNISCALERLLNLIYSKDITNWENGKWVWTNGVHSSQSLVSPEVRQAVPESSGPHVTRERGRRDQAHSCLHDPYWVGHCQSQRSYTWERYIRNNRAK